MNQFTILPRYVPTRLRLDPLVFTRYNSPMTITTRTFVLSPSIAFRSDGYGLVVGVGLPAADRAAFLKGARGGSFAPSPEDVPRLAVSLRTGHPFSLRSYLSPDAFRLEFGLRVNGLTPVAGYSDGHLVAVTSLHAGPTIDSLVDFLAPPVDPLVEELRAAEAKVAEVRRKLEDRGPGAGRGVH